MSEDERLVYSGRDNDIVIASIPQVIIIIKDTYRDILMFLGFKWHSSFSITYQFKFKLKLLSFFEEVGVWPKTMKKKFYYVLLSSC